MYQYSLYGVNIRSNCELEYLFSPQGIPGRPTIRLEAECGEIHSGYDSEFHEAGKQIVVSAPQVGRYLIDFDRNLITARMASPEHLYTTLPGLPLCAMVNNLGGTVLHCSSVSIGGDGLMAFVGDSGKGKSTLAFLLSLASPDCTVWSDDGLSAWIEGGEARFYGSCGYSKIAKEAIDAVEKHYGRMGNAVLPECDGKLIVRSRDHRRSQKGKCLRAIYFIDRTDGRQFVIQPMSSLFSKYMIFTRVSRVQLLGRYFAANMNRIISIMVQTLRVYRLLIPNDIGFLCSNAQELLDLLQH